MAYLYIFGCIFFTVYGQVVLKWRISQKPELSSDLFDKVIQLVSFLFDPFVFSAFFAAFVASLFWMAAMTKFSLSYAYPFMSSAFVLVMVLSVFIFGEALNFYKVAGTGLIVTGIVVMSMGYSA